MICECAVHTCTHRHRQHSSERQSIIFHRRARGCHCLKLYPTPNLPQGASGARETPLGKQGMKGG
eukprot:7541096-Alexandrium_andersonii.AAC.1